MRFPLVLVVSFTASLAAQQTITVPGTTTSIPYAISIAQPGDTILVAPGTYMLADLDFGGKNITLRSTSGPSMTTINANQTGRGMRFISGEGPSAVIEGFRFLNGRAPSAIGGASPNGQDGGGILIRNSSPTIRNCIVENCNAGNGGGMIGSPPITLLSGSGGNGGGIAILGTSSPTLIDLVVKNCNAGNGTLSGASPGPAVGGSGGGIFAAAPFSMTGGSVQGCSSGTTNGIASAFGPFVAGDGGGIHASAPMTLDSVDLLSNSTPASGSGRGGAIFSASEFVIQGCYFGNNSVGTTSTGFFPLPPTDLIGGSGGAIACVGTTTMPRIIRRTSLMNSRAGGGILRGGDGGAIYCGPGSQLEIEDVWIGGARAGTSDIGPGFGGGISTESPLTVRRCTFLYCSAGFSLGSSQGGSGGALCAAAPTRVDHSLFGGNFGGWSVAGGAGMGGRGGAAVAIAGAVLEITRSTFVQNAAGTTLAGIDPEGALTGTPPSMVWPRPPGQISVTNSIIWDNGPMPIGQNVGISYSDVDPPTPGIGNISADPRFSSLALSNQIAYDSPCIDASGPLPPWAGTQDLDGEPSIIGVNADMGCDEVLRAGTGDGLQLLTFVNDPPSVASNAIKTPTIGANVGVSIYSVNHILDNELMIVGLQWTSAASPPTPPSTLPFVYVDPTASGFSTIISPNLPYTWTNNYFIVPPSLSGLVLRIQVFSPTPLARNGFLAASAAHDIVWP